MKKLNTVFPGLQDGLSTKVVKKKLRPANKSTVREKVITGSEIILNENHPVNAECALIIWYDDTGPPDKPVVGEFSFRYKENEGQFSRTESLAAYHIMNALATMSKWIDATGVTKTRFVYGR